MYISAEPAFRPDIGLSRFALEIVGAALMLSVLAALIA